MNELLKNYIETEYMNDTLWFADEVNKPIQKTRTNHVFELKEYLNGIHKVLERKDVKYKDKEYIVKKLILNQAKTLLNFHTTYIVGKPVTLTGNEKLVKTMATIYKYGGFNNSDFTLTNNLVKFGDGYEYIYKDGTIKSKVISNTDAYPVFDDFGNYVSFIESWTNIEGITYWNVYDIDKVEMWSNNGGTITLLKECTNTSHSLPIHYYGISDNDERFGEGLLDNIKPILDELEDLLSKMGDSIYTLSLNPLLVTTGQMIDGSISSDAVGYNISLENGSDMKYVSSEMDYNNIKLYLDTINQNLNMASYMPSIVGGNSNIANVSEVSLKLLYQLADVYAMLLERILRNGFNERINIIRDMIGENEIDEYIDFTFNFARPQNATELIDNLNKLRAMNAISVKSVIDKSPLQNDTTQELERLKEETNNCVQ